MKSPWVHAAAWACGILVATSVPTNRIVLPAGFAIRDDWVHFAMYMPLAFLVFRAIGATWPELTVGRRFLNALLICSLFGGLDELHQHPIPGRTCDIYDWMADSLGVLVAISIAAVAAFRRNSAERNAPFETHKGDAR